MKSSEWHSVGAGLGWTVTVWKGDRIVPKRTTVLRRRFTTDSAAVAAVHELEAVIRESGKLPTE